MAKSIDSRYEPGQRSGAWLKMRVNQGQEFVIVNLPEARSGRWGEGLTAEKMKDCRWLRPELVGQLEFVEWTPDGHLRHARFVGLKEDKNAREVRRI